MLLVSAISLAGFSQSKDVAKLDKRVVKKSSVIPEKKQTGGVPFIVVSNVPALGGCPETVPGDVQLKLDQYPTSGGSPASATCATQTIAACDGAFVKVCIWLIHPSDITIVNGFYVPIANARIIGCCYKS